VCILLKFSEYTLNNSSYKNQQNTIVRTHTCVRILDPSFIHGVNIGRNVKAVTVPDKLLGCDQRFVQKNNHKVDKQ